MNEKQKIELANTIMEKNKAFKANHNGLTWGEFKVAETILNSTTTDAVKKRHAGLLEQYAGWQATQAKSAAVQQKPNNTL